MARTRTSKRKMTIELIERNELLNLRLIGEAFAQHYRRENQKGVNHNEKE